MLSGRSYVQDLLLKLRQQTKSKHRPERINDHTNVVPRPKQGVTQTYSTHKKLFSCKFQVQVKPRRGCERVEGVCYPWCCLSLRLSDWWLWGAASVCL